MSLTAIGISFEVAKLVEFREGGGGGKWGGKLKSILGEGRETERQRERGRERVHLALSSCRANREYFDGNVS